VPLRLQAIQGEEDARRNRGIRTTDALLVCIVKVE
jgi:hypothetical protein